MILFGKEFQAIKCSCDTLTDSRGFTEIQHLLCVQTCPRLMVLCLQDSQKVIDVRQGLSWISNQISGVIASERPITSLSLAKRRVEESVSSSCCTQITPGTFTHACTLHLERTARRSSFTLPQTSWYSKSVIFYYQALGVIQLADKALLCIINKIDFRPCFPPFPPAL